MNNRVSLAMYKHFQDRGYRAMRFNFRGVGRSKGVYNNGEGELSDAATALDWIEAQCPNARVRAGLQDSRSAHGSACS